MNNETSEQYASKIVQQCRPNAKNRTAFSYDRQRETKNATALAIYNIQCTIDAMEKIVTKYEIYILDNDIDFYEQAIKHLKP